MVSPQRLAQRLLDPAPAGNCKLQTLRQYYRLPERGAHTALGDVQTVADLMAQVLRPIAGHRGLDTWEKLVAFAAEEWFPSRIAFGKHKGRLIQEARKDAELRGWLDWLAKSANARNAKMGRWYLRQLEMAAMQPDTTVFAAPGIDGEPDRRVWARGLQDNGGDGSTCRPGALTGRVFEQVLELAWTCSNCGSWWRARGRGWRGWKPASRKRNRAWMSCRRCCSGNCARPVE